MKHCDKCKITTNTPKKQCPVCFNELDGEFDGDKSSIIYNTEKHKDKTQSRNRLLTRVFSFLTISISSICVFINVLTFQNVYWSAIVILALLYVWVLVRHTIISKRGAFEKILFQFIGILAVVLASNFVAGGENWFWEYVVPSAALATTTVLSLILMVNKKRSDYILSAFTMTIFVIIISVILITTQVDKFKLLNSINLLYSGLFALAILVFGSKFLKRALQKNLHI